MVVAEVNQQPPVHQFRTRPFKPFWDEPKTHSLPLLRDFQPLSLPQIFPPSHLPHLISYSLHCQSSRELQSLSNLKLQRDVRHKEVESSTFKKYGEEKARATLHPKHQR